MEIEVNEYVRLEYGKIDRVKNTDYYMQQYIECEKGLYPRENIVKHSKNLIDLIEIGDILEIKEGNDICYLGLEKDTETMNYNDIREGIKNGECQLLAILTKEKFTQNCYEVEG